MASGEAPGVAEETLVTENQPHRGLSTQGSFPASLKSHPWMTGGHTAPLRALFLTLCLQFLAWYSNDGSHPFYKGHGGEGDGSAVREPPHRHQDFNSGSPPDRRHHGHESRAAHQAR